VLVSSSVEEVARGVNEGGSRYADSIPSKSPVAFADQDRMEALFEESGGVAPPPSGPGAARFPDDPEMAALAELFLDELLGRIESMRRNLGVGDLGRIQFVAHQLRGAAGGYGFPEVGAAAGLLEDLLKRAPSGSREVAAAIAAIESSRHAALEEG
jgi:HPt (histidine-containing phosphotransfer) domain-containing protein